jgi:cyclohexanone monooxygenase
VIKYAEENSIKEVEATQEAQDKWVAQFTNNALAMIGGPDCTPGYYNNEGQPIGEKEKLNAASYPAGPAAFFKYLKKWTQDGEFTGLSFK